MNSDRLMPRGLTAIILALSMAGCGSDAIPPAASSPPEVPRPVVNLPLVVYSTIPESRLQPVVDAYKAETGKKIQLVTGGKDASGGLANDPGSLPAADLLLVGSLSEMWLFAEKDGFRPTFSESIEANIPGALRDPEFRWTALGVHGRIVAYNTGLVADDALGDVYDYAALGEKQWRGKLCLSSSRLPGNQALVAFLISQKNLREAEILVRSWRANLAANFFADDFSLVEAISAGQCAIGITGSDTLVAFKSANTAAPVALHRFPDPESVVVDASGGGVARHAHNPTDAADLLVWLTTKAPNALYAAQNQEFPANAGAPLSRSIESWRDQVSAPARLSDLAYLLEDAMLLIERARYQ